MILTGFLSKGAKRVLVASVLLTLVFSLFDWRVFSEGGVSAALTVSESTVHSGTMYTVSVELSDASGTDLSAEISRGDESFSVLIPAGQKTGSVEVKAGSYGKTTTENLTLKENSAFASSEKAKAKVKVLPKPSISFNAKFLMVSAGRELKVYFKCKNADRFTVALPVSLRKGDGTVLKKFTVNAENGSFYHKLKVEKNWTFPYSLTVYNELTGKKCASIPVMVTDNNKPGIRKVDTTEKKIALGFDCGYNNLYTDYILDTLDEYDAKVTFFVTGFFCKGFPDQLKTIYDRGHEIGNHTMHHLRMNELTAEKVYSEIDGVNQMVHDSLGIYPKIMRPSYGSANYQVVAISRMLGCETVFWTEDSYDWDPDKSAEYIINRATKNMGEGCILLFHNSAPKTKETLRAILDDYKAKGLKIVPISELLYDGNYVIDADGVQKPDPDLQTVSGEELLGERKFTVNVTGASSDRTELALKPVFVESTVIKNKKDIEKIKADPSLMTVSYDFGDTVSAPVKSGDTIGKASFSYGDEVWFTADMTAAEDVDLPDERPAVSSRDVKVSDADIAPEEGDHTVVYYLEIAFAVVALVILMIIIVREFRKTRYF